MTPVRLKYWQHSDLWSGRYDIGDWFDIMDVIIEEEQRQIELQLALRGVEP